MGLQFIPEQTPGGGGVNVQDEGTPTVTPATTIDFTGAGISVVNSGGGKATVNVPGGGSTTAALVSTQSVGASPPNITLESQLNNNHSSGVFKGGVITNDAGNPAISEFIGQIRATNNPEAVLLSFKVLGSTVTTGVTDNVQNFVYAEYNAGTPRFVVVTTRRTDFHTSVLIGTFFKVGATLHINIGDAHIVSDHANFMIQRLGLTLPFAREHNGGAVLSAVGTRNIAISLGKFWSDVTPFTTDAFNSSTGGEFTYWHADAGWTAIVGQTQIDNLQYDTLSGLGTLANNAYGVHWIYIEYDSDISVVYGTQNGTRQVADDAEVPISRPPLLSAHARLIGKIIIKKGEDPFIEILSSFSNIFVGQAGIQKIQDDLNATLGSNLVTGAFTVDGRNVSADGTKLDTIETSAKDDQTGAEIKTAYQAEANAYTDTKNTKLSNIETLADVTDNTNVAAAGATMDADTSLAGNAYFLDEDTLSSDDPNKVPSQQSVKKYVDDAVIGGMTYKGKYNANTNTPDLDSTPIATAVGDTYVVSVAGTFFTIAVEAGDQLVADIDSALVEGDWNVVQSNLTPATIKSLYESNSDTNEFDDAEQTKLASVETDAKDDQTGAEIKTAYQAEANAYTDTKNTKLGTIEDSAKDDQTDSEIETAYNAVVGAMSQATAEAGTSTTVERVTAQRIAQAIKKQATFEVQFSCSDLETSISTGTVKGYARIPYSGNLIEVVTSFDTPPTGSVAILDINKNGTTVLSTKLSVPAGAETSAGTPTAATGSVELTGGGSGSVDSVVVNSVTITSGVVNFNTSLDQTATDVAANITANTSSPNYTAVAVGAVITITAVTLGAGSNGFAVVSSTTTITTTDINMAGGIDAAVISVSSWAKDDKATVDFDQVGSSEPGKGVIALLIFERI